MDAISTPSVAVVNDIVTRNLHLEGPLLPILHDLQDHFGYVPPEAETPIVDALNISRAELHGVLSFYHDFRTKPQDNTVIHLCQAEACRAVGAKTLADQAQLVEGVEIKPIYCLGLCANGPSAMVGSKLVANLDETKLDQLIKEAGK